MATPKPPAAAATPDPEAAQREVAGLSLRDLASEADELLIGTQPYISAELASLAAEALELHNSDIEESSLTTYRYLTRNFENFCDGHGLDPFAISSLPIYIVDRLRAAEPKATMRTRIMAIRRMWLEAGRPDPTQEPAVRDALRGAIKKLPIREPRRVEPARLETLEKLVAAIDAIAADPIPPNLAGRIDAVGLALRDRALVLFGFAIGRRGSELARVDVEHIERRPNGLLVKIPYSKTNKTGEPEVVGVPSFIGNPLCPVHALDTWLAYAKITSGPAFVTLSAFSSERKRIRGVDLSRRLEAIASRAGLPGVWRSHSLRRGVVTSAEARGVARSRTKLLTGWKSDAMFSVYVEHDDKIEQSPLHEMLGRS